MLSWGYFGNLFCVLSCYFGVLYCRGKLKKVMIIHLRRKREEEQSATTTIWTQMMMMAWAPMTTLVSSSPCILRLHAASKSLQNTRKRFLVWGKIFSHDVQNFYFVLHPLISMSFALYSCVWRPLKREFWWRKKSCTSLKKFLRTRKSANQGYRTNQTYYASSVSRDLS